MTVRCLKATHRRDATRPPRPVSHDRQSARHPVGNVGKDFWVCWMLYALYCERPAGSPRLLFKGRVIPVESLWPHRALFRGIDITVFRAGKRGRGAEGKTPFVAAARTLPCRDEWIG